MFAEVAAWRRGAAPNGRRIFTLTQGGTRCPSVADFDASHHFAAISSSGSFASLAA